MRNHVRKPGEDDEKRVSPGKTGRVGKYEREGCGRRSLSTKINKKKNSLTHFLISIASLLSCLKKS